MDDVKCPDCGTLATPLRYSQKCCLGRKLPIEFLNKQRSFKKWLPLHRRSHWAGMDNMEQMVDNIIHTGSLQLPTNVNPETLHRFLKLVESKVQDNHNLESDIKAILDGTLPGDSDVSMEKADTDAVVLYCNARLTQVELQSVGIKVDKRRFLDAGEIEFCLDSIARFGRFRRVYVVVPTQAHANDLILPLNSKVITHKELNQFAKDSGLPTLKLPNFNSNAIEALVPFIPNLSNRFVYFNDDCFLGRQMDIQTYVSYWVELDPPASKPGQWRLSLMHTDEIIQQSNLLVPVSLHCLLFDD